MWAAQGVAKHFREVFAALVPGGKAELVMHKRQPPPGGRGASPEDEAAEEADGPEGGSVSERYSGVGVKVRGMKLQRHAIGLATYLATRCGITDSWLFSCCFVPQLLRWMDMGIQQSRNNMQTANRRYLWQHLQLQVTQSCSR